MADDVEIWLLFAPFWLLGTFASLVALWHLAHFVAVHSRALVAGHAPSPLRLRNWNDLPERSRHHLKRAIVAALTFVGLVALGLAVGAIWTLWRN